MGLVRDLGGGLASGSILDWAEVWLLVMVSPGLGGFSWGFGHVWTLPLVPQFWLGGIWGAGSCVPPAVFRGEAFVDSGFAGHVLTWSLVSRSTLGGHVWTQSLISQFFLG